MPPHNPPVIYDTIEDLCAAYGEEVEAVLLADHSGFIALDDAYQCVGCNDYFAHKSQLDEENYCDDCRVEIQREYDHRRYLMDDL